MQVGWFLHAPFPSSPYTLIPDLTPCFLYFVQVGWFLHATFPSSPINPKPYSLNFVQLGWFLHTPFLLSETSSEIYRTLPVQTLNPKP